MGWSTKKYYLLALSVFIFQGLVAQSTPSSYSMGRADTSLTDTGSTNTPRFVYPQELIEKGIEGKVVVRFYISEKGKILKHEILESPHPLLTQALIDYFPKLQFTPAIRRGRPIKCYVIVPFGFKIPKKD